MDIRCLQNHMKGQKVCIEGNTYTIDGDGIAHNVSDADAKEMLKMPVCWAKLVSRNPVAAAPVVQKVAAPAPVAAPVVAEPVAPAVSEAKEAEWPDPDESMDAGYLRKMAEAYEVKFDSKTTKKVLVKAIKKAMYE